MFTVKVLEIVPPAIENPVANDVGCKPLIVLLVNCSLPVKVVNVPVVGKTKSVVPVVFNVMSEAFNTVVPVVIKAPPVFIFPPNVMVFPVLFTPVPPFAAETIPVTLVAVPKRSAVIVPAVKFPLTSLLTIAFVVLLAVAAFASIVAALIFVAEAPPTFSTVGASAVPPKSFANWSLPFVVVVASGVVLLVILAATNAVVAN